MFGTAPLWPSRPTHNSDLGSFRAVKSAGAEGRLTFGAFHPAVAKTIRSGEGEEMSAPERYAAEQHRAERGLVS